MISSVYQLHLDMDYCQLYLLILLICMVWEILVGHSLLLFIQLFAYLYAILSFFLYFSQMLTLLR